MVAVVRYYGGTMLGIPGLINAYKTTAAEALDKAGRIEKNIEVNIEVTCDYTVMNEVLQVFRQFSASILEREQILFCRFRVGVPVGSRGAFEKRMGEIRGVEMKAENTKE
jgi:putative IMPACT (imprinted ancient) family translation regulator